jgi:hypothetical protein
VRELRSNAGMTQEDLAEGGQQGNYDTLMATGGPDYMLEFAHGYTYSAHPVACAAGIATLDSLVKENMVERVAKLAPHFEEAVHSLKGAKQVADIRNYGLAAGLTIAPVPGEPAKRPFQIAEKCLKKGFYVRFGGDTIQLAPPFMTTEAEIDSLINALGGSHQRHFLSLFSITTPSMPTVYTLVAYPRNQPPGATRVISNPRTVVVAAAG